MTPIRVLFSIVLISVSPLAIGQESGSKNAALGKMLWDTEQQWLCSSGTGPYHKDIKDCVEFRNKSWTDQFFEINQMGKVSTKAEMIAEQRAGIPTHVPGVGPYPDDFKLMAVYGNVALAVDRTRFKTADAQGHVTFTSETHFLRIFVKENGIWKPAGGASVPIASKK